MNPTIETRTAVVTVSGNRVTDKTISMIQDAGITTVTNEIKNPKISIYPNPANTTLFIIGLTQSSKISLFDLSGKILIIKQITNNQFDISNLANGIYIIIIVDGIGTATKKFVKR